MLKRFIRYLYEYEQGKRMRNVGFVKVDQEEEACVVHIHGKGLRLDGERELSVFLFYEQDKECIGLSQGVIENVNPAVNYQLRYTKEDVGVPENFSRIEGIIMENKSHRKYAAVWDDMPVNVSQMRLWNAGDAKPQTQPLPEEERPMARPEERPADKPEQMPEEPAAVPVRETMQSAVEAAIAAAVGTEAAAQATAEAAVETETAVKMAAANNTEVIEAEPEESDIEAQESRCKHSNRKYTKMQRQEIASLPRCEWKLSNNSFLIHGYYNYHHLMLIEEDDNCWLGVPGIYHGKEAKAAETFGFPQFIRFEEVEIDLPETERNDSEEFGYWCRHIRK